MDYGFLPEAVFFAYAFVEKKLNCFEKGALECQEERCHRQAPESVRGELARRGIPGAGAKRRML
jgi:hypothetical protein